MLLFNDVGFIEVKSTAHPQIRNCEPSSFILNVNFSHSTLILGIHVATCHLILDSEDRGSTLFVAVTPMTLSARVTVALPHCL